MSVYGYEMKTNMVAVARIMLDDCKEHCVDDKSQMNEGINIALRRKWFKLLSENVSPFVAQVVFKGNYEDQPDITLGAVCQRFENIANVEGKIIDASNITYRSPYEKEQFKNKQSAREILS